MNRKFHNTVTALAATTGLLVLTLMAARPAMAPAPAIAPVVAQGPHASAAAKQIEARAARLQARLAAARNGGDAIGEIAGFAAEAATLAAIAAAFDQADALAAGEAAPVAPVVLPRKRAGRQSVAMPFFSFAPRG